MFTKITHIFYKNCSSENTLRAPQVFFCGMMQRTLFCTFIFNSVLHSCHMLESFNVGRCQCAVAMKSDFVTLQCAVDMKCECVFCACLLVVSTLTQVYVNQNF